MSENTPSIGPYLLEQPLGRGGMGLVYRARHQTTNQLVALKTVRLAKRTMLAGMRREIRALARLEHPGIIRIVEHGVHGGLPWYAMELLEGDVLQSAWSPQKDGDEAPSEKLWWTRTLAASALTEPRTSWDASRTLDAAALHDENPPQENSGSRPLSDTTPPMDLQRGIDALHQLCLILAYLHGEGIVHRDVKPENVLVLKDGRVVLVDFGLASSAFNSGREHIDLVGQMAGTIYYMAPEIIEGQRVDARADLYAVGCMLYQILTGAPPFSSGAQARVLMRHLHELPRPIRSSDSLPQTLSELALALLEKRPEKRPGYAEDVASILSEALETPGHAHVRHSARPYLYRPELVRRTDEMAALRGGLDALGHERRVAVLVSGRQGQGKTRLLNDFLHACTSLPTVLLFGRCHSPDKPLHPFAEIVEERIDALREQGEDALQDFVLGAGAALVAYFDSLSELASTPTQPTEVAERLAALDRLILQHTDSAPAVLVFDDLHLADADTLSWIEQSLNRPETEQALLFVSAFRTSEALESFVVDGATSIELLPLDRDSVRAMLRSMLATETVSEKLIETIFHVSGGNPFFVVEFLRFALDQGSLKRDLQGLWHFAIAADSPIPSRHTLMTHRIDTLSPPAHRLACAIALHGGTMHPVNLCPCVLENGFEGLDELVNTGILKFDDEGALAFTQRSFEEATNALLNTSLAHMLHHTYHIHYGQGDPGFAFLTSRLIHNDTAFMRASVEVHRELADPVSEAFATTRLAQLLHEHGDLDEASATFEHALALLDDGPFENLVAFNLLCQSKHQRRLGATEQSQNLLERAQNLLGDQPAKAAEALVLCERIHQRFARGLNAPRLVKRLRALRRELDIESESLVSDATDAVEAALTALEAGAAMLAGEALSRLSKALRAALVRRASAPRAGR